MERTVVLLPRRTQDSLPTTVEWSRRGLGRAAVFVLKPARRFDDSGVVAEKDRALASAGALKPSAEFSEVLIRINDITFHRLVGGTVVATIVESHPLSAEFPAFRRLGPAQ
jgi:hypothetical protein